MTQTGQYIEVMLEGLQKKTRILDRIIEENKILEQVVQQPEMDMEQFREVLDKKDEYVQEILRLDTGFESLYSKVREELQQDKQQFQMQIQSMQQLIREITDKIVVIREAEEKNRLSIENRFAEMRKGFRVAKKGVNVAQNYYKSMSKLNIVDSQFMDKKN